MAEAKLNLEITPVFQPAEKDINIMLDKGAYMPLRAHEADAGVDLRAMQNLCVAKRGSVTIDTGVHVQIPQGWYGKLESKSGLNVKHGIVCCGGVIDSGYTGSVVVKLYNLSDVDYHFEAGDKVCQLVIMPCLSANLVVVDSFEETERGENGFGSSGR